MSESKQRLWGIDVIAGIYGVATLLFIWIFFNGSDVGRFAGMILAPIFAILCVGIALRSNIVRVTVLILLGVTLAGNCTLILYYIGILAGMFQVPANKTPTEELMKMPFRVGANMAMLTYLLRSDVRDAFHGGRLDSNGYEIASRTED